MTDPNGFIGKVHTPLVAYIADLPEQCIIVCVLSNQSPTSTASLSQFEENLMTHLHAWRMHSHTLANITLMTIINPTNLPVYLKECAKYGLNGVHQPFWGDWHNADPLLFLMPDALHAWHKFFFDHVLKWVINIMGGAELKKRFAWLQPCVGICHWPKGVSTLKQCMGREHQDLKKVLVAVIAGAMLDDILRAIQAIVDFIFQVQSLLFYNEQVHALTEALHEFHCLKIAIIKAHRCTSKHSKPILHFNMPKLERTGMVVTSVQYMGVPYQYTSNMTKHCHSTHVKTPCHHSNK